MGNSSVRDDGAPDDPGILLLGEFLRRSSTIFAILFIISS